MPSQQVEFFACSKALALLLITSASSFSSFVGSDPEFVGLGPWPANLISPIGETLSEANVAVYGPFQTGFNAQQDTILSALGCNPPSLGRIPGGYDIMTAEAMIANQCKMDLPRNGTNGVRIALDTCEQYTKNHFFERLKTLDKPTGGHSPAIARAVDGRYLYGQWENAATQTLPELDACGGHWGYTPESGDKLDYHYHVQDKAPFTFGCFGPNADNSLVTVEQCRALYPSTGYPGGCGGHTVTVSVLRGGVISSTSYDPWCPCFDATGSNTGSEPLPVFRNATAAAGPGVDYVPYTPLPPHTADLEWEYDSNGRRCSLHSRLPSSAPPSSANPEPTIFPSAQPTSNPTGHPTSNPTSHPTANPTSNPTNFPTSAPTNNPTSAPTNNPTSAPTSAPTNFPTSAPTNFPTSAPTNFPTSAPTNFPTSAPTNFPTSAPTNFPTSAPTHFPTSAPTNFPTTAPTNFPTTAPTNFPTSAPTHFPTSAPTNFPTAHPTANPTAFPTANPTQRPTAFPTANPTSNPTAFPTSNPTGAPTTNGVTAAQLQQIRQLVIDAFGLFASFGSLCNDAVSSCPTSHAAGSLVRLAFHDSMGGPFGSGANGCIDLTNGANGGLSDTIAKLDIVFAQSQLIAPFLSKADLWIWAATVAIEMTTTGSGNTPLFLPFRFGRRTASTCDDTNQLPGATLNWGNQKNFWSRLNYTAENIVAIMGAHSLGRAAPGETGFTGGWTFTQTSFGNNYYKNVRDFFWTTSDKVTWHERGTTGNGVTQHSLFMLEVDIELFYQTSACSSFASGLQGTSSCPRNTETADLINTFMNDQSSFYAAFTRAWQKMTEFGATSLRSVA